MISDNAQKKATKKTCCFNSPCRKTKAFCGPIAKIREKLSKKPETKAAFKIHCLLEPTSLDLS